MNKFKNFLKNINLLNIMLMLAIILFANYLVLPFFNVSVKYSLPSVKKSVASSTSEDKKPDEDKGLFPTDYIIIAEQNLFHPERKIPAEKKDEQQLAKPEFVLYGTLITADTKIAYLEDLKAPYSTAGRGKRQKALLLGNTLSGFTLSDIQHDKVVMVRGENKIEVKVKSTPHTMSNVITPSVTVQPPPAKVTSQDIPQDKPKGSGQPPGIIHTGPPPAGVPVPDEKTLSNIKGAFEPLIMKKQGDQKTEKSN